MIKLKNTFLFQQIYVVKVFKQQICPVKALRPTSQTLQTLAIILKPKMGDRKILQK